MDTGKTYRYFDYLADRGRRALYNDDYYEAIKFLRKAADGFKELGEFLKAGYEYKSLGDVYRNMYIAVTKGKLTIDELDSTLFGCSEKSYVGVRKILQYAEDSYRMSRLAFDEGGHQTEAHNVYTHEKDMLKQSQHEKYKKYKRRAGCGIRQFRHGLKMLWSQRLLGFNSKWKSYFWLSLLRKACYYGGSPLVFIRWVIIVIIVFAVAYFPSPFGCGFIELGSKTHDPLWQEGLTGAIDNFATALYFSVVTFATLGYGDIYPQNTWARICAIIEVVFGYAMFGVLIALAIKKLGRRE